MNGTVLQTIISVDLNQRRGGNKEGSKFQWSSAASAVRLSVVRNGDFLHNLTTTLYSVNSMTMGHCLFHFYPFSPLMSLIEHAAHLEWLDTRNTRFCSLRWQQRCDTVRMGNMMGAFGKHAFLLREHTSVSRQGKTITLQWCCSGAVDLCNATDLRLSFVHSMSFKMRFNSICIWLSFNFPPTW